MARRYRGRVSECVPGVNVLARVKAFLSLALLKALTSDLPSSCDLMYLLRVYLGFKPLDVPEVQRERMRVRLIDRERERERESAREREKESARASER